MSVKILYTIFLLVLFFIIYLIIKNKNKDKDNNKHNSRYNSKDKENSLAFIIVTGIIAAIIGNILIPSDISLFDIFEYAKDGSGEAENFSPGVTLSLKPLNLINTDERDLTATTSPDDCEVNWSSDNENIVIIDDNGHLKAVADGDTIITASIIYKDVEYSDRCNVSVKSPFINVDSFHLLYIGETKNISAEVFPENMNIIWDSNNTNIVSIDENGKIEGISEGTATITASIIYNNITYSAYCDVEVKIPKSIENINENIDNNVDNNIKVNKQEIINPEITDNLDEIDSNGVLLTDESVAWIREKNVHKETSQKTVREDWGECIRFGSSDLNADSVASIIVACDQKYSKFTAEIAPQEGFDTSDNVVLIVYGVCGDEQISKEEYSIDLMSRNTEIELDITGADELYIIKDGDYNMGKIAGQYINGYTGMGVLMRNATLHK